MKDAAKAVMSMGWRRKLARTMEEHLVDHLVEMASSRNGLRIDKSSFYVKSTYGNTIYFVSSGNTYAVGVDVRVDILSQEKEE